MMAANSKELVLSVLEGDGRDRTPVFSPFFGYWACNVSGITDVQALTNPGLAANALINVSEECGFDGVEIIYDFLSPAQACGSVVSMPKYGLIPVIDPVIKNLDDIDKMRMPDPREDLRFVSGLSTANEISNRLGSTHFLYTNMCGPFTLLGELRGLERLFFDLVIEPGAVREMLRFSVEVLKGYFEEMETLNPDAFAIADPTTSGNFLEVENFRKFVLPMNTGIANAFDRRGYRVLWHVCGNSLENLKTMSSLKIDMLSVDAKVSLSEISDVFPKTAIVGNIPPEGALTGGPSFEVVRQSVDCLKEMADRKYILAAGDGLTEDCVVDYVKMMRFASEQYAHMKL